MSRGPRKWYTGSRGTRVSIQARTCPRCGRAGALGLRTVDGHPQWFCKWGRLNKCNTHPVHDIDPLARMQELAQRDLRD